MTDTAELIAKLRAKNMHLNDLGRTALIEDPDCIEAADALASLVRERDEARQERDYLKSGVNAVVNCQSALTRAQVREAMDDLLVKGGWTAWGTENQSPIVERAEAAEARATAAEAERDALLQGVRDVDALVSARVAALTEQVEARTLDSDTYKQAMKAYFARAVAAEVEVASLTAENEKLREALKPFAAEANEWGYLWRDNFVPVLTPSATYDGDNEKAAFTVGDLRRARNALLRSIEGGERG